MPSQSVAKRLDQLEKAVKSVGDVDARLSRVESQFMHVQREIRDEISAIRRDFVTRADLEAAIAPLATRSEMLILHEDLVERLKTLGELWRTPPRKKRR